MNFLLKPIQKNLLKQKTSWLLLALGLFPFILIVTSLFNTDFMQLEGMNQSLSALDFISAIIYTQHQFIFPFIILAFIASTLFYDEIKSGRLVIFKDKPRMNILKSKRMATFILFMMYFGLIILASTITYYIYIKTLPISTQTFLPLDNNQTKKLLLEICGYFLTELIGLSIALTVSIVLTSGYTILVTIFYQLLSMLAPNLNTLKYFFPNSYSDIYQSTNLIQVILIMLGITIISLTLSKQTAKILFKRIEY